MSAMNFNTANQTFRQLLGNGLTYRVPTFQRDYSWTAEEWDDLWQDIMALFEEDGEPAHYMGYLVLQSSDTKNFDIIDGQQRMTTISVLILAALKLLKELSEDGFDADNNIERLKNLQNSYIGYVDPVTLVPRSKLELNRHNNSFYQSYIVTLDSIPQRGLNASEHLIRKAFGWFKERIKGYTGQHDDIGVNLAGFIDSLVDMLFFTVITVTDELNAFKVFETLNARGVKLSATDLLKNYLFSIISVGDSHEIELKTLENQWERIIGLLGGESFPTFLRVFWNSRNKLVRKSDLFKAIRRNITTRELAFQLVRDLDSSAAVYAALRDPHDSMWNNEERVALKQLMMFSVRQPFAMLLAAHEKLFESKRDEFTRLVKSISALSFRYNVICNFQTHDQERLYSEVARRITDGTYSNIHYVLEALRSIYPEDIQFKAAFAQKELRTKNSRNNKIVRYILFSLEKQQSGHSFDSESATYSIEHILPENPSEGWNYIGELKQDSLMYRFGNMTPLESGVNRALGNCEYSEKRQKYAQSDFQITRSVAEHYDMWNEDKIEARQKQMATVATSIWKISFED